MRTQAGILTVLLAAGQLVHAEGWPNWRGPNHNGISVEKGWKTAWPAAGPRQLWKVNVGTGFASVSISGGRVFTAGNKDNTDTVYCFDAETGETSWTFDYKQKLGAKYYEGGPSATPTVDGDRAFTFSKSGMVHCLATDDGHVVWMKFVAADLNLKEPGWGFAGSPLVAGDVLILNAGGAGVALNKRTGDIVWSSGREASGYSTPVPFLSGNQACVALMSGKAFQAVQVEDGSVLWRYPWKTRYGVNAPDPVVVGGDRIFITSGYNHGCALFDVSGEKPRVIWENKNMRSQITSPVLQENHLYGIDNKTLVCLELDSGNVKWSDRSIGKGSLMIADGKLIVLSEKGELYVAETSPAGFKVISRAQVLGGKCWTVPVLANGHIYCRNARGDLVCLDVSGD